MAIDLFDGSDTSADEADLSTIKIDQNFAKRLEHNKRREAHQRLEELKRKGLAADSDTSDESDDDDDDTDEDINLSGKNDLKFFETLVRVKKNDPEILRSDTKIYSSDEEERGKRRAVKERPLYLKDVNARHLIEEGPEFEDEPLKYNSKVYNEEQAEGIKAFLEAEKVAFASVDEEDDILKVKEKPGEAEKDEDAEKMDNNVNEYFGSDVDIKDDNEKFLKKYMGNKMWIPEKDKKPSIDHISDEDDELDKQDKYEAEYNFRFEEGGADRVLGHSRVVEGSVRKKTNSRKLQRKSKEERMAQAEFERKEELKHLKNLKKKEIHEKLEKIRAVAGIGDGGPVELDEDDLEEEFDPVEYDKKMNEMFGDDYYDAEDINPGFGSQEEGDLEKPDFDKEDELLGIGKEGFEAARERFLKQRHVAEEEEEAEEEPKQEDGKRKRKRKISLKEKVELDKELDEYYKLDYEDTIGDLKTRFKYRTVLANRYGLRPEDIWMANEKDLNQYVSLKRLAPYREKEWKVTYHQKLKKDLILQGESSNQKKKLKSKAGSSDQQPDGEENKLSRRSRRRHRQAELKLSHSRLMAYGKIPSKHPKRRS
ncbi:protein KRI1 homolog [Zingiber officinale]|uniref:Kri1-like C-terminal domain-containing protein n=1 Tax=Zingiber officinale TaxID=94328 RepID=A0A8J5HLF6_ZINOF|nr:protein KRI1 homolog [Zingiber officinale]KAG6530038.1 hypothetical protein ZIOFF_012259 [Zingiber officinale]